MESNSSATTYLSVGEITHLLNTEYGLPDIAPVTVSQLLYNRFVDTGRVLMRGGHRLVPLDLVPKIAEHLKNRRKYTKRQTAATDLAH